MSLLNSNNLVVVIVLILCIFAFFGGMHYCKKIKKEHFSGTFGNIDNVDSLQEAKDYLDSESMGTGLCAAEEPYPDISHSSSSNKYSINYNINNCAPVCSNYNNCTGYTKYNDKHKSKTGCSFPTLRKTNSSTGLAECCPKGWDIANGAVAGKSCGTDVISNDANNGIGNPLTNCKNAGGKLFNNGKEYQFPVLFKPDASGPRTVHTTNGDWISTCMGPSTPHTDGACNYQCPNGTAYYDNRFKGCYGQDFAKAINDTNANKSWQCVAPGQTPYCKVYLNDNYSRDNLRTGANDISKVEEQIYQECYKSSKLRRDINKLQPPFPQPDFPKNLASKHKGTCFYYPTCNAITDEEWVKGKGPGKSIEECKEVAKIRDMKCHEEEDGDWINTPYALVSEEHIKYESENTPYALVPEEYIKYESENTYEGAGSLYFEGNKRTTKSLPDCKLHCDQNQECDCIVYREGDSQCWRRSKCIPSKFQKNTKSFDTYVKIK